MGSDRCALVGLVQLSPSGGCAAPVSAPAKNGVPDDHIVLVMADDIATAAKNPLPGVVRNGSMARTCGRCADRLWTVAVARTAHGHPRRPSLGTDADGGAHDDASNLYVYLVGHGGQAGMPIGAKTTSDGLSGDATALVSPQLCVRRSVSCARRASYGAAWSS